MFPFFRERIAYRAVRDELNRLLAARGELAGVEARTIATAAELSGGDAAFHSASRRERRNVFFRIQDERGSDVEPLEGFSDRVEVEQCVDALGAWIERVA